MLISNDIISFLSTNKGILETKFHCAKIGLFGSFARNEQTEICDIDILVVYKSNTPDLYSNEIELQKYISEQFNREVDICAEKWIKPIFKSLVLKDVIYVE
jgi:predicted nucleotidyltransferase